jgi:hypothetical protein
MEMVYPQHSHSRFQLIKWCQPSVVHHDRTGEIYTAMGSDLRKRDVGYGKSSLRRAIC